MEQSLTCSICDSRFDRKEFSKTQRKKKSNRKCKKCSLGFTKWNKKYTDILRMESILNDCIGCFMEDNIIITLSEYAIGFVFNCCNKRDECKNEIVINDSNEFSFWNKFYDKNVDLDKTNLLYATYYSYCVDEEYLNADSDAIELYGKQYRIFCMNCYQNKLIQCECPKWTGSSYLDCTKICGKWESNIKKVQNFNIYYIEWEQFLKQPGLRNICLHHPVCIICNFHQKNRNTLSKCIECKHYFCSKKECGIYYPNDSLSLCLICAKNKEYNIIYQSLQGLNISLGVNVIDIITKYSIGYVVFCCNKNSICNKEIFIEHIANFYQQKVVKKGNNLVALQPHQAEMEEAEHIDSIKSKQYYYYTVHKKQKRGDTLLVYNKQIRIFCIECAVNYCVACKYEYQFENYCNNREICDRKRYVVDNPNYGNNRETTLYAMCMDHRCRKLYKKIYPHFCVSCKKKVSIRRHKLNKAAITCKNCANYYCMEDICCSSEAMMHIQSDDCIKYTEPYDNDIIYNKTIKQYKLI